MDDGRVIPGGAVYFANTRLVPVVVLDVDEPAWPERYLGWLDELTRTVRSDESVVWSGRGRVDEDVLAKAREQWPTGAFVSAALIGGVGSPGRLAASREVGGAWSYVALRPLGSGEPADPPWVEAAFKWEDIVDA